MNDGGSLRPEPGQVVPAAYEGTWKFDAPALDSSVPQSRHAVRDLLVRRRVPIGDDLLQGVLLIVSELVTNAVRHAGVLSPQIGVELSVGAGWVRVAVSDQHPYRPKALQADDDETGGRGLLLVKTITNEAGGTCDVQHTVDGGKVIWASFPLAGVTSRTPAPSAPGWPALPRPAPS